MPSQVREQGRRLHGTPNKGLLTIATELPALRAIMGD
jgi:hypothetical protein